MDKSGAGTSVIDESETLVCTVHIVFWNILDILDGYVNVMLEISS